MIKKLFLTAGLLFSVRLMAGDLCAVTISVAAETSQPVSAPAELIDSVERIVSSTRIVNGIAEFCDFGFGEHTIHIGGDSCGSITLHHVHLVSGVAQKFRVVLDNCLNGAEGGRYPPSCLVYLRVASESGTKLGAALHAS